MLKIEVEHTPSHHLCRIADALGEIKALEQKIEAMHAEIARLTAKLAKHAEAVGVALETRGETSAAFAPRQGERFSVVVSKLDGGWEAFRQDVLFYWDIDADLAEETEDEPEVA